MRGDIIVNVSIYIFSIISIYLTYYISSPLSGGGDVGPYFFPRITIIVIFILNMFVSFKIYREKKALKKVKNSKFFSLKNINFKMISLFGLMVGYLILLPLIGYKLSTGILMVLMLFLFNVRSYKVLTIIPVSIVAILIIVFDKLLRIPLP